MIHPFCFFTRCHSFLRSGCALSGSWKSATSATLNIAPLGEQRTKRSLQICRGGNDLRCWFRIGSLHVVENCGEIAIQLRQASGRASARAILDSGES
jgi:hypothetical protein